MQKLILTLTLMTIMGAVSQAQVTGPVEIPGNEYAFQWDGDPDIGLFFSLDSTRYEFMDATGTPEVWFNPIDQESYFRGQVSIGINDPVNILEVKTRNSTRQAIAGLGRFAPTNGYLGAQGGADFGGITGLTLYTGYEMGVVGISTGSSTSDNLGVLGYSNGSGVRGESATSGYYGDLGTLNHGGYFNGRVQVENGELVTLASNGYITVGSESGLNMAIGRTRLQSKDNGVAHNMNIQPYGGNLIVGTATETFAERLFVQSDSGQTVARFRIDGATKFRVNPNGGVAIGSNVTSTPTNGLYVNGDVVVGTSSGASGYKMSINGKVICEELTVQNSTSWPDYVFEDDYQLTDLRELSGQIEQLGHLPGIPSATEVAEKGASVGEMNRLLLEKVEELTLYIIELNEKIIELENN